MRFLKLKTRSVKKINPRNTSIVKQRFFVRDQIQKIEVESHGTYKELLFDQRWRSKREVVLIRDNFECRNCKSTLGLQVHHRQYHFFLSLQKFKSPWDYENHLLITLCEKCHSKGHRKFKVPNVYI